MAALMKSGEREEQLDRRQQRILRFVVELFVTSGQPVGSRTISKFEGEHLSAASIRNTMADLEEMGYLVQPHTSAGRVPTDLGYRYYVDILMDQPALPVAEQREIKAFFKSYQGVVGSILEKTSKLLSSYSHYIGIVSAPQFESAVFSHVDFIKQGPDRVLVIFVDRAGLVHNKMIRIDADISQEELNRIGEWVVERFHGMSLTELRRKVEEMLDRERAMMDMLVRNALYFARSSFADGFGDEDFYVEGTINIFEGPDFTDREQLRVLMRAIEEKRHLLQLLNSCLDGEGVQVVIGSESDLKGIRGCSLVASAYTFPDGSRGSIGVLGPTRMLYPRTVFLVDLVSKQISRLPI
ncbi:MAG TPA: heat-inducible transcriptional repressor HrcA [Acidobacteriota bacterium]|nr:heat-inducible transcriptional repressor HrcA [Acidobacteriota bacterium]